MAVYCNNCGKEMGDEARFCSACGTQMPAAAANPGPAPGYAAPGYSSAAYPGYIQTRMYRPRTGRMLAGVCQGLAVTYRWDVVWVRVLTVLLTIFGGGLGLVGYVIFWIVMPEEPYALPATTTFPSGS